MNCWFTVEQLNRVVKFVHALNALVTEHQVAVDSVGEQSLHLDGEETPLQLVLVGAQGAEFYKIAVVSG